MSTRTYEQLVLPGFNEGPPANKTPAGEALTRFNDGSRCNVAALVAEARTYGLSLEQLLALVRAEWQAQSET